MAVASMEPRGFKSRKLWLAILTQALIFAYAVLGIRWPAAGGLLPAVIGGLLGVAGMYLTSNVVLRKGDAGKEPGQ